MAQTTPPTITPAPPAPQRGNKATFSNMVDAFLTWMVNVVAQFAAVATNVYNNAVDAFTSATTASAAAVTATTQANAAVSGVNAAAWVSGTTYSVGQTCYSPINFCTYRRRTNGAGTTDPSADAANWLMISHVPYALTLLATIQPTAAINIDFLNVFSSEYDDYLIIFDGLRPDDPDMLRLRLAVGGVVDTGTKYGTVESASAFQSGTDYITILGGTTVHSGGGGVSGRIVLQNLNSATGQPRFIRGEALAVTSNASPYTAGQMTATYTGLNAVSGFRLYWAAGSDFWAQGAVRVYGFKKA